MTDIQIGGRVSHVTIQVRLSTMEELQKLQKWFERKHGGTFTMNETISQLINYFQNGSDYTSG